MAALLLLGFSARAVPALPGAFKYTQPDGSVVSLVRHGDEFFSWTTLAGSDQVVALSADGYWRPSSIDPAFRKAGAERRSAMNMARRSLRGTHNDDPMTHGERHIPVLLVAFSDLGFTISDPQTNFTHLLNQNGYSDNGGTGSVQDYFIDNSHGAFTPVFDVYGPVTLSQPMSYYGKHAAGANDAHPELALYDAAKILDGVVDFSQYDYDSDGMVDMVLFYYAGYSEAEGGSVDSIWPHQWSLQYSSSAEARNARFDGKLIGSYFCSSELRGNSGATMCGIGTTTHEFSHSLGLPDFYDTDYEQNGYCGALYAFSVMCSGCYNNDGRTPPYFNAEERILLGWMSEEDVPVLPEGSVSFGSIKDDIAWKSPAEREGEYFLYECRDGSGWDAPLPKGLVVYHLDKSSRHVGNSGYTAWELWEYMGHLNKINCFGSHPCFYVIPSADQSSLDFAGYADEMVFPGLRKVTIYSPEDWDGEQAGWNLKDIAYSGGTVSFSVSVSFERLLVGTVRDVSGQSLSGVRVVLSEPAAAMSAVPRLLRAPEKLLHETITDAYGDFSINLEGYDKSVAHLTFTLDGFQTIGMDVTLKSKTTSVSVTMLKMEETEEKEYHYYDDSAVKYVSGFPDWGNSQMASIRIPKTELSSGGGTVRTVTFMPLYPADAYYVVIDAGGERIFTQELTELGRGGMYSLYTATLYGAEFPGGKDLYIGYAVENAQTDYYGYPFIIASGGSHTYFSPFNLDRSDWCVFYQGYELVLSASIVGKSSGDEPPQPEVTLADMGFSSISDPGKGHYSAGDAFALNVIPAKGKTVQSDIVWTLDGKKVTSGAKSVSLPAGEHILMASFTLSDGSAETLEITLVAE